ncbi:hypothetical protein NDU88_002491 [Pleurodeles waltl]|uniref:Uncharacterized protein n=1 Tax=Pleurodeles waltl TaxID=8319 RepID=A0AAV7W4P8_PLEWA|nr:hypothetical protein NDU88_002491 [Pleurodeles waltl]
MPRPRVSDQQGAPPQPLRSHLASPPDNARGTKRAPKHLVWQSIQRQPSPSATASTSSSAADLQDASQGRGRPKIRTTARGLPFRLQAPAKPPPAWP